MKFLNNRHLKSKILIKKLNHNLNLFKEVGYKKNILNTINYLNLQSENKINFYFLFSNLKNSNNTNFKLTGKINITNYLIKQGKYEQNLIANYKSLELFFKLLILQNSEFLNQQYTYSKEFIHNFCNFKNFKNSKFLLNWIFSWTQPIFFLDCSVVPKKYKKKLKKKYLYKIKYLNKNVRLKKGLKWITNYSNTLNYYSNTNRMLFTYLDLALNYKNSYIYQKKINIYKKIFKI